MTGAEKFEQMLYGGELTDAEAAEKLASYLADPDVFYGSWANQAAGAKFAAAIREALAEFNAELEA